MQTAQTIHHKIQRRSSLTKDVIVGELVFETGAGVGEGTGA